MKDIRHFIWDFDGTLFDTYPMTLRILESLLEEQGLGCDSREAMALMLSSIGTALDFYAERSGLCRETFYGDFHRLHRASAEALEAAPMEGAREALEAVLEKGGHNYIFTHRSREETRRYLEKYGLEGCFREIFGPESPGFARKPAPDGILRLMERHGMTREDAVMIGDRDCDLGSARSAGIRTAHPICPTVPQDLQCDWRLEDLRQLMEML